MRAAGVRRSCCLAAELLPVPHLCAESRPGWVNSSTICRILMTRPAAVTSTGSPAPTHDPVVRPSHADGQLEGHRWFTALNSKAIRVSYTGRMSEQGQTTPGTVQEIAQRRRRVHQRTGRRRWRKGLVGTSEQMRRRLTRTGLDRRSSARLERKRSSRALHQLGEITSHAGAGLAAVAAVLLWLLVGWITSFPTWWAATLYATSSSITLVMVFAIQHTQARQQAAIQRKLDEVIRAMTTANNRLIAVEEAPDEELEALADLNIEDRDRSAP